MVRGVRTTTYRLGQAAEAVATHWHALRIVESAAKLANAANESLTQFVELPQIPIESVWRWA